MFGRKMEHEWPEPESTVQHVYDGTAHEAGEHEVLARLHRARECSERAEKASREAERLMTDADEELAAARRDMRRISER